MRDSRGRTRSLRLALGVTLVFAASAVLGGATATATTTTPFNKNLVKNPGAEAGAGTSGYSTVDIPHWHRGGPFTVVRYGAPGFPAKSEGTRIGGGRKFFSCGQNTNMADAYQAIKLNGLRTLIDNGHVKVILKARMASYGAQQDSAQADVTFGNTVTLIGEIRTPTVAASDDVFISKSVSGIVPSSTTFLLVQLTGTRANNGGTYCDAYFDNISVVLKLV